MFSRLRWIRQALAVLWAGSVTAAAGPEPLVLPDLVVRAEADTVYTGEVLLEETTGHHTRIPRSVFAHRTTDLGEVLAAQAGVQVRRTGGLGSFSTATLRGASAQQVQVLLDGLPLNGAFGGLANLGEIPLGRVRDVSIYRGSVPLQFARGGIGGAVDVRTLRAGDAARTELAAGGGSFGTARAGVLHLGRHAGVDLLLAGEYFRTDNDFPFLNDNGTAFNPADDFRDRRRNAGIDQGSVLLKLGAEAGRGRLDGLIQWLQRREGLPGRDNGPLTRASLRTGDWNGQVRYTADGLGDGAWNATGRLFAGRRTERFDDRDSRIGLAPQHTDDTTWRYGFQAYLERLGPASTWSANLQLTRETYASHDLLRQRAGLAAQRLTAEAGIQLAGFAMGERLLAVPALRLLALEESATGAAGQGQVWLTPQIGLRFQLREGLQLRANAARYVRPPAFFERFGDRGFVVGNPGLRAETGTNLDLGVQWRGEGAGWLRRWRLDLTGFHSDVQDLIAFVYDARGVGRAVNIGRAGITGLEVVAEAALETDTRLVLNFTWQEARNRSPVAAFDERRLPGRYRTVLDLRLEQRFRALSLSYRLHLAEGLFYDRANLLPADTVLRHDLGLELDLGSWTLALQVENLTDRNFEQFNGYPTPGRAWYATLTHRFDSEE